MKALEIENLTKSYRRGFWGRKVAALTGLTLEVGQGEIFGFIGANGAGKTTTFKVVMGLARPDSGTARILGLDMSAPRARRNVGFLPEEPYYYTYQTARELLFFYGRLQGMRRADIAAAAGPALETVGLARSADVRLGEYSKGMRQRFGIAQALINDPALLFLDEPLSGLDPAGRKDLKDLIVALKGRGKTVFFSSHILSDAEAICDRIALIRGGRLEAVGSLSGLLGSKVKSYEIQVAGLSEDAVRGLGFKPGSVRSAAGVVFALEDGTADPAELARRVGSAGGKVVGIIPFRETLEDFFMRFESGGGGARGQGPGRAD